MTTRRQVLGNLMIGGSGLALGCGAAGAAPATPEQGGSGERGGPRARIAREHALVPLPFDPAALEGLSERLLRSHHENNYAGAVSKLNESRRRLAEAPADTPGYVWGALAKSELTFANSVLLHELYFENLGGEGQPAGAVDDALAAAFRSRTGWEEDFRRCAMSLAGGSGWVVLAYDLYRGELAHRVCSDHGHAGAMDAPLLVLDMYEHSYHLDYGADAARYLEAFAQNVRWDVVASRLERARRLGTA